MPSIKKTIPRPWIPKSKKRSEGTWQSSDTNAVYHTSRWRRLRALQLQSFPICIECKRKAIIKQATVVDHIVRIKDGGESFDMNNLQSLCTSCHNSKSGKEAHKPKVY